MTVQPLPTETRERVVRVDISLGGRYVSFECQLGAHHACPGGLRTETQHPIPALRCRCVADGCGCNPVSS